MELCSLFFRIVFWWCCFNDVLGVLGALLAPFWEARALKKEQKRVPKGVFFRTPPPDRLFEPFWEHFGSILGGFWEDFGRMKRSFNKPRFPFPSSGSELL